MLSHKPAQQWCHRQLTCDVSGGHANGISSQSVVVFEGQCAHVKGLTPIDDDVAGARQRDQRDVLAVAGDVGRRQTGTRLPSAVEFLWIVKVVRQHQVPAAHMSRVTCKQDDGLLGTLAVRTTCTNKLCLRTRNAKQIVLHIIQMGSPVR